MHGLFKAGKYFLFISSKLLLEEGKYLKHNPSNKNKFDFLFWNEKCYWDKNLPAIGELFP